LGQNEKKNMYKKIALDFLFLSREIIKISESTTNPHQSAYKQCEVKVY